MAEGMGPVVRGRHLKALVDALERWDGGARPLALLPASTISTISRAAGFDWLPVELDLQLTEAIYEGLGGVEGDRFFRRQMLEAFEGPILRTLATTAVRLFGLDPVSFARWVPRAWSLIFQDVGEWRVEDPAPGAASMVLTLTRLPAQCAGDPRWLRSAARSMEALFDLAKVSGEVELARQAPGAREARFTLRWTPKDGRSA